MYLCTQFNSHFNIINNRSVREIVLEQQLKSNIWEVEMSSSGKVD